MKLSTSDLESIIYKEETGTLATRIDYAWSVYTTYTADNKEEEDAIKENALLFLVYALDITDTKDVNTQLIKMMDEREQHKTENPEYIPGKSLEKTAKEMLKVDISMQQKDLNLGTKKLTPEERGKYRVNIHNGKFTKDGENFDTSEMSSHDMEGYASFTLNANGELSIFTHKKGEVEKEGDDVIFHSSMNPGSPIIAAGALKIKNGVLEEITTYSGHYKPSLFHIYRILEYFTKNKVDISSAKVITFDDPSRKLKHLNSRKNEYDNFETPVTQIFDGMKDLINQNINSINEGIKLYNQRGPLTKLFEFIDKIIGSELTKKRAVLASDFETNILKLQKEIETIKDPKILETKIIALDKFINDYQEKNKDLSIAHNKNPDSGRLAKKMEDFKNKVKELKEQSKEFKPEEYESTMKKIR